MKSTTIKTVAVLLSLVGVIFGIVLGFACQIPTYSVWYDSHKEYAFNVGLMFETWMFFDLLALFFGWLASVLEKLENIERSICGKNDSHTNVNTSANGYFQSAVSNIHTAVDNIQSKLKKEPSENEWKCPKCGRINQNYVGTCGCGEVKPKTYT